MQKNRARFSLQFYLPFVVALAIILNIVLFYIFFRFYTVDRIVARLNEVTGMAFPIEAFADKTLMWILVGYEAGTLTALIAVLGLSVYFWVVRPLVRLNKNVNMRNLSAIHTTARLDEIGQLTNSFAHLSQDLEDERKAQLRIIASISHDIKTPLTSVLGYSERLIKKDLDDEKKRRYLSVIYEDAKVIADIVSEFDEFLLARQSASLNLKRVELSSILRMLADEYGSRLTVRAFTQSAVLADEAKLRRVFANLFNNAVKHNGRDVHVSLTIADAGDFVSFTVKDDGAGAPNDSIPYLFEPFFTTDQSRSLSGLGLSICQNIVNAHGGEISAPKQRRV